MFLDWFKKKKLAKKDDIFNSVKKEDEYNRDVLMLGHPPYIIEDQTLLAEIRYLQDLGEDTTGSIFRYKDKKYKFERSTSNNWTRIAIIEEIK